MSNSERQFQASLAFLCSNLCISTVILTHSFGAFFNGLLYTGFRQCRTKLVRTSYVIQQLQAAKMVQFFTHLVYIFQYVDPRAIYLGKNT